MTTITELPSLERNHIYTTELGDYQVKSVYLLSPGEAGNTSSQNHLLGIDYEYTNQTDASVANYLEYWSSYTTISEMNEFGRRALPTGVYKLATEEISVSEEEPQGEEIKTGETVDITLYYEVPNIENELTLTTLIDEAIEDFQLDIETLLKLPPQSALYVNKNNPLTTYLFDFDRLYLIYSEETLAEGWTESDYASLGNIETLDLSPEAELQITKLDELSLNSNTIVELSPIYFEQDARSSQLVVDNAKQEETAIVITGKNGWTEFEDGKGNVYLKLEEDMRENIKE